MLIGDESRPVAARAGRPVVSTVLQVRRTKFALAHADAARERAGIVVDPVVGDLQEMRPAVDEDAAAALGAVGDTQPIDARRVAHVIAREPVDATGSVFAQGVVIRSEERRVGKEWRSRGAPYS